MSRSRLFILLVAVLGVSLALVSASPARPAKRTAVVLPASGKVAGEGYAYYERRSTQKLLDSSVPVAPCQTLLVHGQVVGYLPVTTIQPITSAHTCREPQGRPLYVVDIGNECSTAPGDHGSFGTSDTDLMRCAKALFYPITEHTTVDDRSVDTAELITGPPAYPIRIPKNPLFPLPPGEYRSATYGPGLLIVDLSTGIHTIHMVTESHGMKWTLIWTIDVEGRG